MSLFRADAGIEETEDHDVGADADPTEIVGRTPWQLAWTRLRHDRVAMVSLGFIVLLVLVLMGRI